MSSGRPSFRCVHAAVAEPSFGTRSASDRQPPGAVGAYTSTGVDHVRVYAL
jgi:hypothetical protein